MSASSESTTGPAGKMVLFKGTDAPSLDETGMMDEMTYAVQGANDAPMSESDLQTMRAGGHLTVPFRQTTPDGLSLVEINFAPGYLLPKHSHSSDCLYYIVTGSIVMGRRTLGAGDGFFLPAEQVYAYRAGPAGVTLLEFRNRTAFDMKVHEKDMADYSRKAISSMSEASESPHS
jgi:quercetin dioxygenase-like cupin family protein